MGVVCTGIAKGRAFVKIKRLFHKQEVREISFDSLPPYIKLYYKENYANKSC
jgi:hypothetical protein